jgi:dipeptidase
LCDTQLIRQKGETFFAKNSDREASEPQIVCFIPPVEKDASKELQATHISIPQSPDRHGVILSKPAWMWGAEMGVNDCGVVIGNEAVFSKLVARTGIALLGMDLVRLGLERGESARQALDCITQLLQTHGQGGPAGFRDKSFRYDNSFIIADSNEAWVLETAGKHWVAKQVGDYAAISNAMSIEDDFDLCSPGLVEFARENKYYDGKGDFNFARAFDTRFMKRMGCALARRAASLDSMGKIFNAGTASFRSMASSLRQHANGSPEFSQHDNRDVCMHAGGLTRPSQTCGSMIVRLRKGEQARMMITGTSAPCLSLFQPVCFPLGRPYTQTIFMDEKSETKASFWFRFETVHRRALLDKAFRSQLLEDRDSLENTLFALMENPGSGEDGAVQAEQWHRQWHDTASNLKPTYRWHSLYDRYWKRLNKLDNII